MLRNGLYFVAREAAQAAREPAAQRYVSCLILGSLREDVIRLPFVGFSEYPSFSHFGGRGLPGGYLPLLWPGPGLCVSRLYRRALVLAEQGRLAAAFVALGRAAHVLSDVSIPSHVYRAAHDRDPFEWWIEGNLPALSQAARTEAVQVAPRRLVRNLAAHTATFRPDHTNHPLGRALKRAGRRRSVAAAEARQQALALIPHAVSHVRALVDAACSDMRSRGHEQARLLSSAAMRDEEDVLAETLSALDLPERMLKPWFDHNRAFCDAHGGRRVYPGLLDLLDRCDAALARRQGKKAAE